MGNKWQAPVQESFRILSYSFSERQPATYIVHSP